MKKKIKSGAQKAFLARITAEAMSTHAAQTKMDVALADVKFQSMYRGTRYYPIIETTENFCISRMVDNEGNETVFNPPRFYGNVKS